MNRIEQTEVFGRWLSKLRDPIGRAAIIRRINRARRGNFGDNKDLKGGLYEMRVFSGPGYRLYYTQIDGAVYLLLVGGDKTSQGKDIETARTMIAALKAEGEQ